MLIPLVPTLVRLLEIMEYRDKAWIREALRERMNDHFPGAW